MVLKFRDVIKVRRLPSLDIRLGSESAHRPRKAAGSGGRRYGRWPARIAAAAPRREPGHP